MAHVEICPICRGKGTVPNPDPKVWGEQITCHGCGGCGWVTVNDLPPHIPAVSWDKSP